MKLFFTLITFIFFSVTVPAQDHTRLTSNCDISFALRNETYSLDIIRYGVDPRQTIGFKPSPENIFDKQKIPSKPVTIRLRCRATTFSPDPVLVIDGYVYDLKQLGALNPNDIESISILKDASATTLYGCRGVNGVIIITTKVSLMKRFIIRDFFSGEKIPKASIWFTSANDSSKAVANDSGELVIDKLKAGIQYTIIVSSAGYKTFSTTVKGKEQEVLLERDVKECGNVILSLIVCRKEKISFSCTLSGVTITGLAPGKNKNEMSGVKPVYPNPIQRNNVFNLEFENAQDETMQLAIISMSGTVVSIQSKKIYKGLNRLSVAADAKWAAGIYNIQLRNEKGTLTRQEKIVVQ